MPFLVVLKRFEVWLLLVVVAGLLAFALSPEVGGRGGNAVDGRPKTATVSAAEAEAVSEQGDAPPEGPPEEDAAALRVERVAVIGSAGGRIVETTLAGRPPEGRDLLLDEASVSAATEAGEVVARFFEPFREPASLAADGGEATLRWWLPQAAEALWIEVDGRRLRAELP